MNGAFTPLVVLRGDNLLAGLVETGDFSVPLFAGGRPLEFIQALESLDLPGRELQLGASSPGGDQVTLSIALDRLDLWAIRRAGARLQAVEVLVYAYAGEACLADAVELYRGIVDAPSFNLDDGIVTLSAVEPSPTADTVFPPAMTADPGRFSGLHESSKGATVPVIYGRVYGAPLVTLFLVDVDTVRCLIAGHPIHGDPDDPGHLDVLRARTDAEGPGGDVVLVAGAAVKRLRDGRGEVYSAVDVPVAAWTDSGLFTGTILGMLGPEERPLVGLGDVIDHMVHNFGRDRWQDLATDRIRPANRVLNRYSVGVLFNERLTGDTLLSLLASRFGGQFPVVFGAIGGRFGWDVVLTPPPDAPPALALTYGVNAFQRTEVRETPRSAVRNTFILEWGYRGSTGRAPNTLERRADNDERCRASASRWGRSAEFRWQAADVADSSTAVLLAAEQVSRQAEVFERVGYLCTEASILRLPYGSVIDVTDDKAGWSGRRFLLESVRPASDGTVAIGLVSLSPAGLGPGIVEPTATIRPSYTESISSGG